LSAPLRVIDVTRSIGWLKFLDACGDEGDVTLVGEDEPAGRVASSAVCAGRGGVGAGLRRAAVVAGRGDGVVALVVVGEGDVLVADVAARVAEHRPYRRVVVGVGIGGYARGVLETCAI
jgi:hypothetical protein